MLTAKLISLQKEITIRGNNSHNHITKGLVGTSYVIVLFQMYYINLYALFVGISIGFWSCHSYKIHM